MPLANIEAVSDVVDRILRREKILVEANEAYHNADPILTDASYDTVWREHEADRKAFPSYWDGDDYLFGDAGSILDWVGAAPRDGSGFQRVKHGTPMQSINDVFEGDGAAQYEELLVFVRDMEKRLGNGAWPMQIEPKVDGLAIKLIYSNGLLELAVTRGDGEIGDDVTNNVRIAGIVPQSIAPDEPWDGTTAHPLRSDYLPVIGEIYMPVPGFIKANEEREQLGLKLWANPRNAASGSIKLLDEAELRKRPLAFVRHDGYTPPIPSIRTVPSFEAHNWEQLLQAIERVRGMELTYATDGAVVKLANPGAREVVGLGTRAPNWACAFKFKPVQAETKLLGIHVQVGRTGVLAPVAVLEPVHIDGSTVSSATLHNEGFIQRMGLRIGDTVILQKAGAIIPEIVGSVDHKKRRAEIFDYMKTHFSNTPEGLDARTDYALEEERPLFDLIAHIGGSCPSCGWRVVRRPEEEDVAAIRCTNPSCHAQMATRIEHACSRKCLDIEGIGEEVANALARDFIGKADAYDVIRMIVTGSIYINLTDLQWTTAAGGRLTFGALRATKAIEAGKRAKSLPLHRWLWALGIYSIGENTSKELSRLYETPEELILLSDVNHPRHGTDPRIAAIGAIDAGADKTAPPYAQFGISSHLGPVSCRHLLEFAGSDRGREVLALLQSWGIKSDRFDPVPQVSDAKPLVGKTFVITGTLSVGRDEMKALIESKGGKVSGSVSAKTDYLVAGEGGGSKAAKAQEKGVKIIDEATVRSMMQ